MLIVNIQTPGQACFQAEIFELCKSNAYIGTDFSFPFAYLSLYTWAQLMWSFKLFNIVE